LPTRRVARPIVGVALACAMLSSAACRGDEDAADMAQPGAPNDAQQGDPSGPVGSTPGSAGSRADAGSDPNGARPLRMLFEEEQSGSRLKLRYARTTDGLVRRIAVHDSELGTECAPSSLWTAGGKPACVLLGRLTLQTGVFTDENCTTRGTYDTCDQRFGYAIGASPTCGYDTLPFRRVGPGSTTYFRSVNGRCVRQTSNVPVVPIADMPTSSIATLTAEVEAIGLGLSARWLRSADGLKVLDALLDASGQSCTLGRAADGALRCLPGPGPSRTNQFRDASCSAPAYAPFGDCNPRALVEETAECPPKLRAFKVERSATSFARDRGVCSPNPEPAIVPGAEIPPDAFAEPTVQKALFAGGRLERTTYRFGDAALHGAIRDTKLDVECTPQTAADSAIRCVPVPYSGIDRRGSLTVTTFFADASCTKKLGYTHTGRCNDTRFAHESLPEGTFCGAGGTRVYATTGRFRGTVYATGNGRCTAVGAREAESFEFYELREIPAGDLVPFEADAR
jgi:hypothetical protein